jgi:hypothetical protein
MGTYYRDHDEIRARVLHRLPEIAHHLSGGTAWLVGNSWRFGKKGVYSLHRGGAAAGFNGDFQGDVIDAVAHFCTGGNRLSAFDYLRERFDMGVAGSAGPLDPALLHQLKTKRARKAAVDESKRHAEVQRKRRRAFDLWRSSQPIHPSPAELYLSSRGILRPEGGWSPCIRYSPNYPIDRNSPALLFAIQGEGDRFVGIQSVALTPYGQKSPDGNGTVKKTWPSVKGGTIRFGRPAEVLFLTEGPEDAISIAQLLGCSAWACAGISLLKHVWLPPGVGTVVIMGHADEAGVRGAEEAKQDFQQRGLRAHLVVPPPELDWNDLLQAGIDPAVLWTWIDEAGFSRGPKP